MKTLMFLAILFFTTILIFKQVVNPMEEKKATQIYFTNFPETSPIKFENTHLQITDTIEDTTLQSSVNTLAPDNNPPIYNMPVFIPDSMMQNFEKVPYEDLRSEDLNGPVFIIVDTMPKFLGGETALKKYIDEHIEYPEAAYNERIEGVVYVTFIVDKYGKVMDPKIAKGVNPILDNEAIRVIRSLPDWEPGKQNGVRVNVHYTLPVKFKL